MNKRLLVSCLAFVCFSLYAQDFKVEIKQVFPKKATVYSNTFRFKREMESAVSSQSSKYRGNNNNYSILIETSSGKKETRPIQNIVWVESVNGAKTYHKKPTSPASSYKSATVWQGCACAIDGSPKGAVKKEDFIYRVSLIGSENEYETDFISLKSAKAEANKIFAKSNTNDSLVEVVIYKFVGKEKTKIDTLTNKKEYLVYKEKLHTEDSLKIVNNNQLAIKEGVEKFLMEMTYIHNKKDSLKNEGIKHCRITLEETARIIPDSIFISERLDSTYKSIFITDILSNNKNKVIKELLNELQTKNNGNDSLEAKAILLLYTKQIENIVFPSVTNTNVLEDAYRKVVPIGVEPYQFEIGGIKYSFYEEKHNEGVLVNEKTKEYEVGTFEPVRGADNKFIFQAKKVKKYSRDGKKI